MAFAAAQQWLQEQQVEETLLAALLTHLVPSTREAQGLSSEAAREIDFAACVAMPQSRGASAESRAWPIGPPPAAQPLFPPTMESAQGDVPVAPPSQTRYLNAGFYLGDAPVPESEPLWLVRTTYQLAVNLGAPWGPGRAEAGIPEQLLAPLFEVGDAVELDVVARSQDLGVSPPAQKIRLPKKGDSATVFFAIELTREGRQSISVDLLYQGHLLQSRRIEVTVAAAPGLPTQSGPIKEQEGYLTFTRTAELGAKPLTALKESPRQLTIVAERDPQSASIGLRFYDQSRAQLAYQDSRLSEASLTKVLEALRSQLARVMTTYAGPGRGTPQELGRSLGALADLGRRFYRALLPGLAAPAEADSHAEDTQALRTALVAGGVVQVAPLSAQLSVPWELLYERPIETYREERIRLCTDFAKHGPDPADCPNQGNPQVVCPYGFWGYRYIIEQLPCRVDRSAEVWTTLPLQIDNQAPLHLLAVINSRLGRAAAHVEALRALPGLSLQQVDNLLALQSELAAPQQVAEVVYFYTHGGCDEFGSPYLELAPGSRLQPNDLDAWQVRLPQKPLVVLNACDSANYSPERFDDLIQLLYNCGAAGVLGTQCEVRELLAGDFMVRFLGDFLRQVPAGQALLQARTALLRENDPRGLAYSLFAAADVKLGRPVL